MIPTNDLHAAVRLFAFALAGDYEQADELIQWAYKGDTKKEEKAEEPSCLSTSEKEFVDYYGIRQLWNDTMKRGVPKVKNITQARKDKMRLRVKEMGGVGQAGSILKECFDKINASDFCNGSTGWIATFDWFFSNASNWMKVAEGNYDNRRGKTTIEQVQDEIAKADAYYEQRYGNNTAGAYGNKAGGRYDGPDEQ